MGSVLILLLLFLIVVLFIVVVSAISLSKKSYMNSIVDSQNGIASIVHDNASKTVTDSMSGAMQTINTFGFQDFDVDNFYNSLNIGKDNYEKNK